MDPRTFADEVPTRMIRITVLGLGHVGLPTAVGLAELGWRVLGTDQDAAKIASLQQGRAPFYEPGLQELLSKHLQSGRFVPIADSSAAIRAANVLFVCVGTPQRASGEPDLSQVETVARTIARNLEGYKLIVEKSTVPVITAQWIKKTIERYAKTPTGASLPPSPVRAAPVLSEAEGSASERAAKPIRAATHGEPGQAVRERAVLGEGSEAAQGNPATTPALEFDVASNPEFLQEGKALHNFFHPDRIVCGVESERAWEILRAVYEPIHCPILRTDLNTAELIKHAANAFLATKISFINLVADLCERVGADVTKVVEGIGRDPRIGMDFLRPGIGFGGYCLPKDLRAFVRLAETHGVDFALLKEVERINQQRAELFLKKVRQALWVLSGKVIGVLGLAFKPNTDDIREAPSIQIVESLLAEGASLQLYDPRAMANMRQRFPEQEGKLRYCSSPYEAARGAHALLILTEWEEFRKLDLSRLREQMEVPILLDGRNLYDPASVRAAGFEYISVGR
ncbi:MAG: hypothetical protein A3J28_04965 [Acidobacteria bacterium RIFCSPLOWO2_12_FULL_60_22]|nr:MAG: hypothetical protein A3J28_04965 [Acidobacteria bacterium RIFCSPLOWO2_12_FULL_60_22]